MLFQKLLFLFLIIISVHSRPQLQPSSWISQIVNTAVQKVSPVIGLSSGSNEQTHQQQQAHSGSVENHQQGNSNFGGYSQVQNVGGQGQGGQNSNPNYPGPASGWSMLPLGLGNKSPASNNYKSGLNQQQNQQQPPQGNQYQQQQSLQQQFNGQTIQQQIQNLPNQPQNIQQQPHQHQQQQKESIFSSIIGGGNKVLGNGPIRQNYKSPYPKPAGLNVREESQSSEENDSEDEKPVRKPAVKKTKPKIKKQKPKNKAKPKAKPVAKKPTKTTSNKKTVVVDPPKKRKKPMVYKSAASSPAIDLGTGLAKMDIAGIGGNGNTQLVDDDEDIPMPKIFDPDQFGLQLPELKSPHAQHHSTPNQQQEQEQDEFLTPPELKKEISTSLTSAAVSAEGVKGDPLNPEGLKLKEEADKKEAALKLKSKTKPGNKDKSSEEESSEEDDEEDNDDPRRPGGPGGPPPPGQGPPGTHGNQAAGPQQDGPAPPGGPPGPPGGPGQEDEKSSEETDDESNEDSSNVEQLKQPEISAQTHHSLEKYDDEQNPEKYDTFPQREKEVEILSTKASGSVEEKSSEENEDESQEEPQDDESNENQGLEDPDEEKSGEDAPGITLLMDADGQLRPAQQVEDEEEDRDFEEREKLRKELLRKEKIDAKNAQKEQKKHKKHHSESLESDEMEPPFVRNGPPPNGPKHQFRDGEKNSKNKKRPVNPHHFGGQGQGQGGYSGDSSSEYAKPFNYHNKGLLMPLGNFPSIHSLIQDRFTMTVQANSAAPQRPGAQQDQSQKPIAANSYYAQRYKLGQDYSRPEPQGHQGHSYGQHGQQNSRYRSEMNKKVNEQNRNFQDEPFLNIQPLFFTDRYDHQYY